MNTKFIVCKSLCPQSIRRSRYIKSFGNKTFAVALKDKGLDDCEVNAYLQPMLDAAWSLEEGLDRIPLFNDAGNNVAKSLQALVSACKEHFDITPEYKSRFIDSGFYIFKQNDWKLIVDAGQPGPAYIPGHAHCDAMSFELFKAAAQEVVEVQNIQRFDDMDSIIVTQIFVCDFTHDRIHVNRINCLHIRMLIHYTADCLKHVTHGENGFLCEEGNEQELIHIFNRINGLAKEEKQKLSQNAVTTAKHFSESDVAKRYLENITGEL